jgi:glycosyltransferase involved in cell wall biosynthesis
VTITFISNFLNHHQIPFSDAMYNLIGSDYAFISTTPMDDERTSMGWNVSADHPYEIRAYKSDTLTQRANQLANDSDVTIIGSALDSFIEQRLKNRKLTFKYSERLYKQGLSLSNFPRSFISSYIHHGRFQKYPIYMLCASAYTAGDLAIFGNYIGRTYKWGYFPAIKEYKIEELIKSKRRDAVQILWAGRFMGWKHPDHALAVAKRLDKANIDFQLKMIGNGEEFDRIKLMSYNMALKRPVEFLGAMSPDEVRRHMEEANIYLFTSDFNEGWGAVLNEAMNSGCAVVASHAIGAVPFLLKHGENGLIYRNGDVDDLCSKVISLAKDSGLREMLGMNAYLTMKNTWNADVAADRFVKLSEALLRGDICKYEDGPCSVAPLIKNNWFTGESL